MIEHAFMIAALGIAGSALIYARRYNLKPGNEGCSEEEAKANRYVGIGVAITTLLFIFLIIFDFIEGGGI